MHDIFSNALLCTTSREKKRAPQAAVADLRFERRDGVVRPLLHLVPSPFSIEGGKIDANVVLLSMYCSPWFVVYFRDPECLW